MHMRIHLASAVLLAAAATAQQSSILDRGDVQLSTTQGVIQNIAGVLDAGFNQIDVASPRNFVPAGSGVATPQLVYALYPDLNAAGTSTVLRVRRSTDGGRNWDPPVDVYTADTPGGEDLNTGDEGTHIYAWGDEVYVTFHTNAHDKTQQGQSLWVVASNDQGQTWTPALNVSTGWNLPMDNHWDVDDTSAAASVTGLHLVWEADREDPSNPGFAYPAPNNNENLYYARVAFSGMPPALAIQVPETALTSHPVGGADVDLPTIDAVANVVLIAYVDDSFAGLAPGGNVTVSQQSLDIGLTFSAPFVHSGLTPGTFPLAWAQPRRPWALLDGPFAYVIQEDSRFDEDDVWMDRGDVDPVAQTINWTVMGVMCNHTSTTPGAGDVDGILAAVHNGVIAILYRDDSAGTPLNNSNEGYLVVDRNGGNDFIAGTFQRHMVTTQQIRSLYDLDMAGNVIAGVFETCGSSNEEGGIVLSSDRGTTIESLVFTTLGGCNAGTTDVDDLRVAVSLNGDFNVIYADERLGGPTAGNSNNVAWITGGKYPRLSYDSASFTLTMDKIDPTQSVPSALAFLMISGSTATGVNVPASLGVAGAGNGYFVGLDNEVLYNIMWVNVVSFLAPVGPNGDAVWSNIPNATALFGIPIHIASGTFDLANLATAPFLSYTDAILQ